MDKNLFSQFFQVPDDKMNRRTTPMGLLSMTPEQLGDPYKYVRLGSERIAPAQMPMQYEMPAQIQDPTLAAQLAVLARQPMQSQPLAMLGSGIVDTSALSGGDAFKIPDYRALAAQFRAERAAANGTPMPSGGDSGSGALPFDPFNPVDQFPLGSDSPPGMPSFGDQNQQMMDAGWSDASYSDAAPDMSDFSYTDYSGGSTDYSGGSTDYGGGYTDYSGGGGFW